VGITEVEITKLGSCEVNVTCLNEGTVTVGTGGNYYGLGPLKCKQLEVEKTKKWW
jgi:hypothetical protein